MGHLEDNFEAVWDILGQFYYIKDKWDIWDILKTTWDNMEQFQYIKYLRHFVNFV